MKLFYTISLALMMMSVQAQITKEYTYDNTYADDFGIIQLAVSGYVYYSIDYSADVMKLYNMDHSLLKNVTLPGPYFLGDSYTISYISESLFDWDDDVEFVVTTWNTTLGYSVVHCGVYNDGGSKWVGWDSTYVNVYNTSDGAKMIATGRDSTRVYSLPGTVLKVMDENPEDGIALSAYPNPAFNSTSIAYSLPEGVNQGTILIYNAEGQEVESFQVDGAFNDLLLDTSTYTAGQYFYILRTSQGNSKGKKMIVVK